MWNFIVFIILGALAGWIASIIMNKNKQMGAIANIIVGVIGAFLGGFLLDLLGIEYGGGFFANLLVAVFGAVVFLWLLGLLFGKKRR